MPLPGILGKCSAQRQGKPGRGENVGDFDLMIATVALGAEFRRRGMDSHLGLLRSYYRELRARRLARERMGAKGWDESMVVGWLALLRIPPFENVYQVLPRGKPCPKCGAVGERAAPATFVRSVWPGGSLCECRRCDARWITEEPIDRRPIGGG
jgi:hypothetical protein